MNILRAEHLGMCFGVRDAIQLAHKIASREPLTILGDLVHNPTVIEELQQQGIRQAETPADVRTRAVMITAHGTSQRAITAAGRRGHRVLEATCPLVHAAHQALADLVREGFHPVVIGKTGHVEVRGMTGDLDQFDIVLSESDVDNLTPRDRFGVVAQTTQPVERVRHLVHHLRQRFPHAEVKFVDTVCRPTKQRQHAAEELAHQCDVIVVVGGRHSNNTRELVRTCARHGAVVYHIETAKELKRTWFHADNQVGITAGTSTPDNTIHEVEQRLRVFAAELTPHHAISTHAC